MGKPRDLTPKQRAFVREYLKDGNATQAAIRAGLHPKTAANFMANDGIRAAIAMKAERIEERAEIDSARILKELARVAFVDIGELIDPEGRPLPFDKMPEDARRALVGVDVDEIWGQADDGEGNRGKAVIGQTKKLKLASKLEALKLLGQHLKLFTEVHEHRGDLLKLLTAEEPKAAP